MDDLTRTRIRRYGVGIGAVLLALLLDLLFWPWAKPTAFPLFTVAVMVRRAGAGPARGDPLGRLGTLLLR